MTDIEKEQVFRLKEQGLGYKKIAQTLGVTVDSVKSFLRRQTIHTQKTAGDKASAGAKIVHRCQCCGISVPQTVGRKEKKFCSDQCRMKWWNANPDKVSRKANYAFICVACKKPFTAYGNKNRKYCSRECYMEDRYGRG